LRARRRTSRGGLGDRDGSADAKFGEQRPFRSARLAPELVDEGLDDLDDLVLLRAREAGDLLEGLLRLADGPGAAIGERGDAEELLDGDAEDLGELGKDL